jgi:hypothetical protein
VSDLLQHRIDLHGSCPEFCRNYGAPAEAPMAAKSRWSKSFLK